jgi:hypothetical protein
MSSRIKEPALFILAALLPASAFGRSSSLPSSPYLDQALGTGIDRLVDLAFSQNTDLLATRQRLNEAQGLSPVGISDQPGDRSKLWGWCPDTPKTGRSSFRASTK